MSEKEADQYIETTREKYARWEKTLEALKPVLIIGALAGGIGLGLGLSALCGFAGMGVAAACTFGGIGAGGCAMGFIDRYSCRWGARALFCSGLQTQRVIARAEHDVKMRMPLKDHAKQAFIKALTQGLCEKLHIGRPLKFRKPAAAP